MKPRSAAILLVTVLTVSAAPLVVDALPQATPGEEPTLPAPAPAPTATPDAAALVEVVELQRRRIEELERQNREQQGQLEAMQQVLEALNQRLAELEGKPAVPIAALEERLAQLETSVKERPELPPDVVSAGDFPGSFRVPGTDTAIKIGGQVRTSLVHTLTALGSDDRFLTYSIPVEGTPEAGKGRRISLWAGPSRLNFDVRTPTGVGEMRSFIEGDFAGEDSGFRLRHAYLQYKGFIAGQTWSTFSDPAADHEDIDFEGMNAENVIRQAQVRWTRPVGRGYTLALAGELSQASISGGESVNQLPDLIARLRKEIPDGHLQAALVLKQVRAERDSAPNEVHSRGAWGLSLSGVVPAPWWTAGDRLVFQANGGHGVARYVNDLQSAGGLDGVFDPATGAFDVPYEWGFYVDYEHRWPGIPYLSGFLGLNELRSSLIWGFVNVDPLPFQPDDAYRRTNRLSLNLVWAPIPRLDAGFELIYGTRENKDGQKGDASQVQMRLRYLF